MKAGEATSKVSWKPSSVYFSSYFTESKCVPLHRNTKLKVERQIKKAKKLQPDEGC